MKWYRWHVRRAKIEPDLRNELDLYGETVIAFALGAGKMHQGRMQKGVPRSGERGEDRPRSASPVARPA
jgi:hypothetical protein